MYVEIPSTELGSIPASSSAPRQAATARSAPVSSRVRANSENPMPTIATVVRLMVWREAIYKARGENRHHTTLPSPARRVGAVVVHAAARLPLRRSSGPAAARAAGKGVWLDEPAIRARRDRRVRVLRSAAGGSRRERRAHSAGAGDQARHQRRAGPSGDRDPLRRLTAGGPAGRAFRGHAGALVAGPSLHRRMQRRRDRVERVRDPRGGYAAARRSAKTRIASLTRSTSAGSSSGKF